MPKEQLDAKEKIISITTELIKEHGEASKITIREIAEKSGVGVGLINYHFGSKERLIGICVQRIISRVIDEYVSLYKSLDMSDNDKLRYIFKSLTAFIAANPGISRISMLTDLSAPRVGDNTDKSAKAHFEELKNIWEDQKTDQEIIILLHLLTSSMQIAFLRSNVLKENSGIDFFDQGQRERFIDMLFDFFKHD